MDQNSSSDDSPAIDAKINRVREQFETVWRTGKPQVEDYLQRVAEQHRPSLVAELLAVDIQFRRQAGESPTADDYLPQLPDQVDAVSQFFATQAMQETEPQSPADATASMLPSADTKKTIAGAPDSPTDATAAMLPSGNMDKTIAGAPYNARDSHRPAADGQAFSGYELIEKLGEGGMGIVWKARQRTAGGRLVAIKLIRPDKLSKYHENDRREMLQRFKNEAEAAARLDHDHITTVYDVGEFEGQPYYAMKYVEGQSLADMLKDGPLTNAKAARYAKQIASALAAAHEASVLHRDLKPHNVMIDASNDRALLTDFGLAKLVGEDSSLTLLDRTVVFGSPPYMSPEQARHSGKVTESADIYSLGATLYHLLVGRPPFHAASLQDTLRQVEEKEPTPLRQLNPEVSRDLETICLKCLEKSPAKRYATAADLAKELDRFLSGQPILARPVSTVERSFRWCLRNPVVASLSATAVLLVTAVAVTALYGYVQTNAALVLEKKARQKAVQLAEEKTVLAEQMSELASENAQLAADERTESEKAKALNEFLVGTFKASDPIGMTSATFFIPKENAESLTAREILDRGAERVQTDPEMNQRPLVKAAILDSIGDVYRQLGLFKPAEPMLVQALDIRRQALPADHPDLATSCHNLGMYYHERGNFPKAEPLYREALRIRKNIEGDKGKRLTASTMHNLAWMLANADKPEEAERVFRETIEMRLALSGEVNRETLFSKIGLAMTLLDQHDPAALNLVLEAQKELSRLHENKLISAGITKFSLGVLYRNMFGAKASETQLRSALKSVTKALGADNIYVGIIHCELGATLELLDDLDGAEHHYQASLEIGREKVQLQHPRVRILISRYSGLLHKRGRSQEAKALWEEFMTALRERFGEHHRFIAEALFAQAEFLRSAGDFQAALKAFEEVVRICRDNKDQALEIYATAFNQMGLCLSDGIGDREKAVVNYRLAIAANAENSTSSRQQVGRLTNAVNFQVNLGSTLTSLRKYKEAQVELTEALQNAGKLPARHRADYQDFAFNRLMISYRSAGDFAKAYQTSLQWKQLWPRNAEKLYEIAGEMATLARLALTGINKPVRKPLAGQQKYIDLAMNTLREAINNGFSNKSRLLADRRFLLLRNLPEFQKLIQEK